MTKRDKQRFKGRDMDDSIRSPNFYQKVPDEENSGEQK